jgi:penicillin-binding protein 1A
MMGFVVLVCGLVLAGAAVAGWIVSVADSAPNINQLQPRNPGQVSEVYAANGQLLGYIASDVLRTIVPQDQQPALLREATVAIEDRRFYHHGGVDYQGILRAGIKDLFTGHTAQGGSTLTMQLVDNVYLPNSIRDHHNIRYKIIQAKLANELESRHSKAWILSQYLNDVQYGTLGGQNAIGVGAASQMFFDKPVQKLDLAQYALLAGLPQAPSIYNPFENPAAARRRRSEVLQAMVRSHYITRAQADAAAASPLQVKHNDAFGRKTLPYVFDYVHRQLIQDLGQAAVDRGGLKVYTTIDPQRQAYAQEALDSHEGGPGQPAAALVSINPSNGDIVAMANTSTYGTGPGETTFDYASQARRQTGSAFKVFALMTLIHDYDGDPNQTYYDSHLLAPGWLPGYPTYTVKTAENSYQGEINITKATWLSDNTVFAQLAQDLGMEKVSAMAHQMGITSPLPNYPSEVLGAVAVSPLEMADAYATLASGGVHHPPTAIARVVLPSGRTLNLGDPPGRRVFTTGEAYEADTVLKNVLTIPGATGTAAYYGCPAAGKTGTTSSFTDAYFAGYTPQLTTTVWVGYPNATESMPNGFGGTLAAPIWHDYMAKASEGFCGDFPLPDVLWHGTPYFGHFAGTSRGNYNYGTGTGNSGATQTNPYTNTTLFSAPPQGPPNGVGGGTGAGTGTTKQTTTGTGTAPPGNGNGHKPGKPGGGGNGGAGVG